jgi:signal transduction histidine kinase
VPAVGLIQFIVLFFGHSTATVPERGQESAVATRSHVLNSRIDQSSIGRYTLGLFLAATATALATGLTQLIGRSANPFISFIYVVTVLTSAWWGGYGPGLLSVVLMNFVSPYFLDSSVYARRVDLTRVILALGVSILVSYIASRRNRDEVELRANNDELERRVRERTAELSRANEEQHVLTDELLRTNERLQQTNAELERFAYIASHDLQEPLRTISMHAQLLSRNYKGKLGAEADEMLELIRGGSARMQELVAAILELSRSASHIPEFVQVNANLCLGVAKASLSTAIAEQRASIVVEELPVVYCDATHLTRVFQNLISNALRFRSTAPPEVRISACRDGEVWRFSVEDNGIGIAPEYEDRIFQLFARLHPWTKIPGAGIGLAICKRIVEHHGGTIWLKSEVSRGSTFYFTLPVIEGAHRKQLAAKTSDAASDDAISAGGANKAVENAGT